MKGKLAIACFIVTLTCSAAVADVVDDCRQDRRPEVRLRACSEIIRSPGFGPDVRALAYRHRGEARTEAGAIAQAIADFAESIRLRMDNMPAFAGRGRARFSGRNFAGSIADFSEAIRLSPGSANLYIERGHVYLVTGNADAAIRDLTEAIRLNPSSASAFNNRGLAYRRKGDLVRASEDYSAAIAINPIYGLAYANRGYLHESQGRRNEAIDDLRQALLLDPSMVGARDALRRLGAAGRITIESGERVRYGKALAERNCSGCHAVGVQGASPNRNAPEFRNLYRRHPLVALREPIMRGIAAPHDEMPQFLLSDDEIDTIVAYINSLSARR
jgi:tetratricopeptide (TPR) repeat protein